MQRDGGKKMQVRMKAFPIVTALVVSKELLSLLHARLVNCEGFQFFSRKEVKRQLVSELLKGSKIEGKAALKFKKWR